MPNSSLDAAYRATDYWVDAPSGRFIIRIGSPCPHVDANSWTYITACNPGSQRLPAAENAARMQQLEQEISAAGFTFLRGYGVGQHGNWPPEPSLLILNIDEARARDFGRRFGQAAIVFGRRGEPAQLLWIDAGDPTAPA